MKKTWAATMALMLLGGGCAQLNPFSTEPQTEAAEFEPNRFLWQAAKDKLAFLQIATENKAQGVMVSQWGKAGTEDNEEFQIEVKVLSNALRTDSLLVKVNKRQREGGQWVETEVSPRLNAEVEDAILKQARILYRKSLAIK